MLPPPLNLIPSALAVIHYPLIYIYQYLQRSETAKYLEAKSKRKIIAKNLQPGTLNGDTVAGEEENCSPREQEVVPHKKVISVSGTASDMVVG